MLSFAMVAVPFLTVTPGGHRVGSSGTRRLVRSVSAAVAAGAGRRRGRRPQALGAAGLDAVCAAPRPARAVLRPAEPGTANSRVASDAFIAPASLASRTSRDSRSASLVISSAVSSWPSSTPPLMTRTGCALAKSRRPLAASTGSPLTKAIADGPTSGRRGRRSRPPWPRSWSACSSPPRRTRCHRAPGAVP